MRWSERAPAAGPRSLSLSPFLCKLRAPSVPVAHLVLVRPKTHPRMAAYFYMDSPVAPLFADCLFGFIAGALLRRFAFRLVTSIALPLGIAFICAGPGDLLFGQGEPQ